MLNVSESSDAIWINSKSQIAVLFLHGLGASGYDFLPWVQEFFLDKNIAWCLPHAKIRPVTWLNGQSVPAWYDLFEASTKSKEDVKGLALAAEYVHQQLDNLYDLGYKKVFLGGFSQGAALSLYAGLQYPKSLAGIAAFSGYMPRRQHLAIKAVQNVWLSHGDQDQVLPMVFHELSEASLLQEKKIQLSSKVFSDMGHEINNHCSLSFKQWLTERGINDSKS